MVMDLTKVRVQVMARERVMVTAQVQELAKVTELHDALEKYSTHNNENQKKDELGGVLSGAMILLAPMRAASTSEWFVNSKNCENGQDKHKVGNEGAYQRRDRRGAAPRRDCGQDGTQQSCWSS